jgi:hypothetical protein
LFDFPRNSSRLTRELDEEVLGDLDSKAVDSDSTTTVVGVIVCDGILETTLDKEWRARIKVRRLVISRGEKLRCGVLLGEREEAQTTKL